MPKLFITGTDTEVGKTYVSLGLLAALNARHYKTLGLKPLATGCIEKGGLLFNEDALLLQQAASVSLDYHYINPYRFAPPIAPHIAALQEKRFLSTKALNAQLAYALNYPADWHIIEGVGGFLVPLNDQETMADFVKSHQFPVLLVIGMRLGCLNHALLTYAAIEKANVPCIGWVANCIESRSEMTELIDTLKVLLPAPCLGIIQYGESAVASLNISDIIRTAN